MIKVENLSKAFGPVKALDSISFQVERGEIVGILGPNGAGKTTLMRILTGFFPPTTGSILIDGLDLSKNLRKIQAMIGYLPESAPLYKEMTPEEIVAFSARMKGSAGRNVKKDVERALEACGVGSVKNRLISTLSKGFRQRTAIATALVGSPKILILDEPTSGLDPEQIIEIRDLIRNLSGARTVILSTHILHEVAHLTERILILQNGRLVASDRLENLQEAFGSGFEISASIIGPTEKIVELLLQIPGVLEVEFTERENSSEYLIKTEEPDSVRAEISRRLVEAGFELVELKKPELTLEDIYLKSVRKNAAHRSARAQKFASV